MAFPSSLTNAIDGQPGVGTPIVAALINSYEKKIGLNNSPDPTSLDYMLRHTSGGHHHDGSDSRKVSHADLLNLDYADAGHTGFQPTITILPITQGGTGAVSLASGHVPYSSGGTAYAASPIFTDGTNIGIGENITDPDYQVRIKKFGAWTGKLLIGELGTNTADDYPNVGVSFFRADGTGNVTRNTRYNPSTATWIRDDNSVENALLIELSGGGIQFYAAPSGSGNITFTRTFDTRYDAYSGGDALTAIYKRLFLGGPLALGLAPASNQDPISHFIPPDLLTLQVDAKIGWSSYDLTHNDVQIFRASGGVLQIKGSPLGGPISGLILSTYDPTNDVKNALRIESMSIGSGIDFYTLDTNSNNRNWRVGANIAVRGNLSIAVGSSQGADPSISAYVMDIDKTGNVCIGGIVHPVRFFNIGTIGFGSYTDVNNYEYGSLIQSTGLINFAANTLGSGTDNIDVQLTPAGNGLVRFGTYSAKGAEVFDGFITMKDAAGNSRKVMTCV